MNYIFFDVEELRRYKLSILMFTNSLSAIVKVEIV